MKKIITLVTLFIFSSNLIYGQEVVRETDSLCISKTPSNNDNIIFLDSCVIVNVKETKSFHLIYAQEKGDDCIYKIILEKIKEDGCDNILIGEKYSMQIRSVFYVDDNFYIANYMESQGVLFDDEIIELEKYPVISNLYTLINIQKTSVF